MFSRRLVANYFFSDGCVEFLSQYAKELGLPVRVVEVHPKKPIVVITFAGTNPELPSILLNSHMDVVPVTAVSFHDHFILLNHWYEFLGI